MSTFLNYQNYYESTLVVVVLVVKGYKILNKMACVII